MVGNGLADDLGVELAAADASRIDERVMPCEAQGISERMRDIHSWLAAHDFIEAIGNPSKLFFRCTPNFTTDAFHR
jgi:hypothetical protein